MDKRDRFPALVMFTAGLILAVIVHTHNIKTENEIQNEQIERIEEHIELEKIRRQEEIERLALESSQEEVRKFLKSNPNKTASVIYERDGVLRKGKLKIPESSLIGVFPINDDAWIDAMLAEGSAI